MIISDIPLLVMDVTSNQNYFYTTDANKNISELVDGTGMVVAHYEYDPFGKINSQTGPYAVNNPFRFSREYHDDETGLIYYNYRYYSPTIGRWINRDPIGEFGGVNLYGMVGNNAISYWDELGLSLATDLATILGTDYQDPNHFQFHGHFGGPGWANHQWVNNGWFTGDESKLKNAKDKLDRCFRDHDLCYEKCRKNSKCPSDLYRCYAGCDAVAVGCELLAWFPFKTSDDDLPVSLLSLIKIPFGVMGLTAQGIKNESISVLLSIFGR